MLHNYTDIDLDTVEDLNRCLPSMANQLWHACSKITIIIQRKVHFLYTKNLPSEMHGYGLGIPEVSITQMLLHRKLQINVPSFSYRPLKSLYIVSPLWKANSDSARIS